MNDGLCNNFPECYAVIADFDFKNYKVAYYVTLLLDWGTCMQHVANCIRRCLRVMGPRVAMPCGASIVALAESQLSRVLDKRAIGHEGVSLVIFAPSSHSSMRKIPLHRSELV